MTKLIAATMLFLFATSASAFFWTPPAPPVPNPIIVNR